MKKRKNVLVIGANGTTGKLILDLLAKDGSYYAKGMIRKEEQIEAIEMIGAQPVVADLEKDFSHA